jgi:eukaryotic-like serine/threonine-protein kinase
MTEQADRWQRIAAWFDELVELAPAARAARLAAITAEEPAAAAEVASLLEADAREEGLLEGDAVRAIPTLIIDGGAAPADGRVGPYRLLDAIGEGGMGTVFLAERSDGAYDAKVAVKLIKRGMDSVAIVRRFLRERRILARLAHPNIVRLLDGGLSADSRPYYVMEYVDGRAITEHAAASKLGIRERVALVAKVAEAVAYAHTQLVVHRDLKPSNVLVDAQHEPHVLDFGIAKLLEESGDVALTSTGMRVLSPAYAAPEQVLGEPIGTATDVYALGLMLCELLVGQLPRRRRGANPQQLAREVVYETSERASTLASQLSTARAAELYGAEATPSALARTFSGDIDLIVGTALRREPSRRYPTAAAFADDLKRWLDRRPITARGDSRAYRLRTFVRRHRLGVAAAALVALSLAGGLGLALWQAHVAQEQAQRADDERAHAERQLARSERVKDFILALFREQDPIARAKAQARSPIDLIHDGIAAVDASLATEPELKADLLRDLGEIQLNLNDRAGGEATLKRALELQTKLAGDGGSATAETLASYADAVYASGDIDKASTLFHDGVARLRATHGPEHPKTAHAESRLAMIELVGGHYDEAERLARHAIAVYRATYGAESGELAPMLSALGNIQQETGHLTESLETYGEALAIVTRIDGGEHVRTVTLRARMGDVQRSMRRFDDALASYDTALRIERAQLPPDHAIIGGTLQRLGDLQRRLGRYDDADRSLTESLAILGKGTLSGQYAQALQFHAVLAQAQGRIDLAIERYRASFDAFRKTVGDGVYTWLTALRLVEVLIEADRLDEAERIAVDAVANLQRAASENEYDTAYVSSVMGALRHAQGREVEAAEHLRTNLALLVKIYGESHLEVAQTRVTLAACLVAQRSEDARKEAATLIETAKVSLEDPGRADDPATEHSLGVLYLERAALRRDSGDTAGARADLADAIRRLQAPADARTLRRAQALGRKLAVRA